MGTIYSAITAEMQEQEENLRLSINGSGLPTVSSNFSMGGTYSMNTLGPDNPGSMPTPSSDEFTCGQWLKSQGPFADVHIIEAHANEPATENWADVMRIIWKETEQVLELWADDTGPSWIGSANFVLLQTVDLSGTQLQRMMNWAHLSFYVDYQIRFTVSVYLDGIQIMTYTAGTNWEWLTAPDAVTLFRGVSSGLDDTYQDDSYVEDVSGEGDQIPEGYQFAMTLPDGAGSSTQWTPDAGSNYARVNEATAPDDDTTYVEDAAAAQLDRYTFGNLTEGPATELPFWGPSAIPAVYMQSFYRMVDDSEVTDASYDHAIWDGALASTDGPFTDADDFDWHFAESVFPLQPDGSAWNLVDFNAWEYGIETN